MPSKRGSSWRPREDTVSFSFSTTKGIASTLLHVFIERGLVDLDAPVARYWPEFAQAGKDKITLRQILCHEAGLYDIRSLVDTATRMLDWGYMVEALADGELMKQYLDLMRRVRTDGVFKDDRTGTGTYSVFGHQMRFDLSAGFPLVPISLLANISETRIVSSRIAA